MSLINREALLGAYDAEHKGPPGRARELIADAPTVDAVEVVRCRDCKYFEYDTWANFNGIPLIVAHEICQFNKSNPIKVHEEHYCSWGERKTE